MKTINWSYDSDEMRDIIIEEIMHVFDFEKVHKAMTALNWTWRGEGVPDIPELKAQAIMLMREAWNRKCSIGTGGFMAEYEKENEDYGPAIFLTFRIDEYGCWIDKETNELTC